MPTLTALAPDPRQPEYRLVEVDRGRFASLPAVALEPLALAVGTELAGMPPATKKRRLLAYLARRGYRGAEVRELVEELCGSF